MKQKILVIARYSSFKFVSHAGGKVNYFYINKLIEEGNEVKFIGVCGENEKKYTEGKLDCETYILTLRGGIHSLKQLFQKVLLRFNMILNCFDKYGGRNNYEFREYVIKILKMFSKNGYKPDVIILDWTESAIFLDKLNNYFPNSKKILVEQDVVFLNLYRKYLASNWRNFAFNKIRYERFKKFELSCMANVDQVDVFNYKDFDLLVANHISQDKIKVIVSYFDLYFSVKREITKNIIFYGAMDRLENEEAVVWFVDKVMPKLDSDIKFTIIGNKPTKKVCELVSDRVFVTGFVDDVSVYFKNALCMVVPLLLGAGIKIKVLEGMSASIPVLTNEIGIEGIPATDKKEYMFCNSPEDYVENINRLINDNDYNYNIGYGARLFIKQYFNYANCSYL